MRRFFDFGILVLCLFGLVLVTGCSQKPPAQPYFGTVLLGPGQSAASERLHFIAVGSELYIDANHDGIADCGERFLPKTVAEIQGPESNLSFAVSAELGISADAVSETLPQRLNLAVDVSGPSNYQMTGTLIMSPDAAANHWLHFGGQLRLFTDSEPQIRRGDSPDINHPLRIYVGTIADGPLDDGSIDSNEKLAAINRRTIVVPVQQPPFPTAVIDFVVSDGSSISKKFTMDHFC